MKKILFILVLLNGSFAFGKKVKFAVDMSGQIINPLGIHVTGDFQTAAGFAGGNTIRLGHRPGCHSHRGSRREPLHSLDAVSVRFGRTSRLRQHQISLG